MNGLAVDHFPIGEVRYQLLRSAKVDPELPYLVMLHGFLGTGAVFTPLVEELSKVANLLMVDLPGHGGTDFPPRVQRYHLSHQVADLDALLESLESHRIILYGYSMGGRLALHYAARHSHRLQALVLESTSSGMEGFSSLRERLQTDQERAREILQDFMGFLERWNRLPMFRGGQPDLQQYAAYLELQRSQQPTGIANSLMGFSAALMPEIKTRLRALALPVMVLAGEYDQAYVHHSERLRQWIPGCTMHVVAKAAHRVHLDRPDAVSELLTRFIRSLT